jgi:hypothetical protein
MVYGVFGRQAMAAFSFRYFAFTYAHRCEAETTAAV